MTVGLAISTGQPRSDPPQPDTFIQTSSNLPSGAREPDGPSCSAC